MASCIIDNQVVKHRLVDMFVATEQARAITEAATQAFDGDAVHCVSAQSLWPRPLSARLAGAWAKTPLQLHGAIGMTEEYEVGQAYKRLAAAANTLGDAHWHGQRLLARAG